MRKWLIFLFLIIIGVVAYNYVYQDHRNIATEKPEFKMTASILSKAFSNSQDNARPLYLNKTIELEGIITEIDTYSITIDNQVWCVFNVPLENKKVNSQIKIKGRVIGYDDLLEQVKMDQCSIVN